MDPKLLLLMYAGRDPSRISSVLDAHGAAGWSLLREVTGAGAHGRHEGNRTFPGEAAMLVSIVPDADVAPLRAALREAAGALPAGESLHVAVMPVESFT
jgi:hypothetical protein